METYVADGFDSFEECLNHEIVEDDGTAAALKAGLDVMYRAAQERIDEHFGRFAEHASSTCFAVPWRTPAGPGSRGKPPVVLRRGGAHPRRAAPRPAQASGARGRHAFPLRRAVGRVGGRRWRITPPSSNSSAPGRRTPCSPASRAASAASSLPPPPSSPLRGNSNLCWSRRRRCSAGGSRCPRMSG